MSVVPVYSQPASATSATGPEILRIGSGIIVTQTHIVTPNGSWPLRDCEISCTDQLSTSHQTPAWAIILGLLLIPFTCFLSLLFLLAKDTHVSGAVMVSVRGRRGGYIEQVPVSGPGAQALVADVHGRVQFSQNVIWQQVAR